MATCKLFLLLNVVLYSNANELFKRIYFSKITILLSQLLFYLYRYSLKKRITGNLK